MAVLGFALGPLLQPLSAQGASQGSETIPEAWSSAIVESRLEVERAMAASGAPGLSIAVAVDGEVVWAEGFGWADIEQRVPVEPHTKFRIASISKALTAGALGRLVERNFVDLDLPVQAYVASFPLKEWPLTTRQLAGHQAGIRHYEGEEFASNVRYDDVLDALDVFQDDPLLFEPGTDYSYSTYGWSVISAVLQGATGRSYLEVMRQEVIEPLGLSETVAEHVDSLIPWRARFYLEDENASGVLNAPFVDNSNKWAGGGYLSTARDMARYGSAYLRPGFLEVETIEELWAPQTLADGSPTTYGLGWNQAVGDDGRRRVWHTGGAMGGSTVLTLFPEDGVVVSVLTNIRSARPIELADAVAELFITTPRPRPAP